MRQIGFKNFRKFEDFHVIDLSPITIFVGENNAGKSTVVKAMLSIVDFLKSSMFDDLPSEAVEKDFFDRAKETLLNKNFYFNKNYFAHIGTFSRAIYNKSIDNKITFVIAIEDYKYEVTVEGNKKDSVRIAAFLGSLRISIPLLRALRPAVLYIAPVFTSKIISFLSNKLFVWYFRK